MSSQSAKFTEESGQTITIDLKDPRIAVALAWAVPGLGHLYQGRKAKGLLFLFCILGTFLFGVFLCSNSEVGWGRAVYASEPAGGGGLRSLPRRLPFVCQVWAGAATVPAMFQYYWANQGGGPEDSPLGRLMFPPRDAVELDELHYSLNRYFELGTVYTMIAGLLNILAMFDAYSGPMPIIDDKQKKKKKKDTDKDEPADKPDSKKQADDAKDAKTAEESK